MVRRDVPTGYDIVATYPNRAEARRAVKYLGANGLGKDSLLVEPGVDRLGRAARRALIAGIVGLLVGVGLALLWPGGYDPDRTIQLGVFGFLVAALVGVITPDRTSERASETHVAVRVEWADDARRMLHREATS